MSGTPPPSPDSPAVGELLLAGELLQAVELDVVHGRARIVCADATLEIDGVRATTLLGPWDGAPGSVDWAKVVAIAADELCLEVRVRFATVPRVYRIVCRSARRVATGARAGDQRRLDAIERM